MAICSFRKRWRWSLRSRKNEKSNVARSGQPITRRLTALEVAAIEQTLTCLSINATAKQFGVSFSSVKAIAHGKRIGVMHPVGERAHSHKLTASEVRDIRTSALSQKELAARYGVSQAAISDILRRKTWTHLDDDT